MTNWNTRTSVNTSWAKTRLGGAYLMNSLGEYITTSLGERIIVIVKGGELNLTSFNTRSIPTTNWSPRTPI